MHSLVRRALRLPSPAMVVAVIGLVLAAGGTTYALTLPPNSVGTSQIKAGAVTYSKLGTGQITSLKVRDNSLSGADVNEGTLANNYVALVAANGTLTFGSPGVSVANHSNRQTVVQFPVAVTTKPILVSLAGEQPGQVAAGACGTGEGTVRCAGNATNAAGVSTFDKSGAPGTRAFYILVPRGGS